MKQLIAAFVAILLTVAIAFVMLQPGKNGLIQCVGDKTSIGGEIFTSAIYDCIASTPTPEVVAMATPADSQATPFASLEADATPILPTAMPLNNYTNMTWHPPAAHGDRPLHEHGDEPPQWVMDAGYSPSFDHVGNTPDENHSYWKHTGFKGWAGQFDDVEWYGIFHLDFNPGGHANRFHSFQLWFLDPTGAVSHMEGWLDFGEGDHSGPNLSIVCGQVDGYRPIIMANQQGCNPLFETWYARSGQAEWMPDIGFSVSPNYYAGGDPTDPTTWKPLGPVHNLDRRIEFSWYANRSDLHGDFYTTQFGNVVSGPDDPICGTQITFGEYSYTNVCLKQTIQPTLPTIQFPGNSVQRSFPGPASLPN